MNPALDTTVTITLPDNSVKRFVTPPSLLEVASSIGPGLARATVAGKVNGELMDACDIITSDADVTIITDRDSEGLDIIRHSCAHLVGHAVKQLFPGAKMVIGPVIDDGFYYDIAFERPFTALDLENIEARMQQLIATHYNVEKRVLPREDVIEIFEQRGEAYKLKLIEEIPGDAPLALYLHDEYIDMCRGPHVPNTRFLEHVALTRISGAYWRGDASNEQLQRIYGTAWANKKDLRAHINRVAEAERRDHRRVGKELKLFYFHEEATGAVFWQPNGWTLFQTLIDYMRRRQKDAGYVEVNTPDMMDRALWEISGHWQNYQEHMYTTRTPDEKTLALKPMSCPGSVLMYKVGLKSYRELPIRMSEFGKVHRYEPSGSLHGLLRVRHFTQDDAHIYCTPGQLQSECTNIIELVLGIYRQFGFDDISIKLSTRPENRMGDDATWDTVEAALVDSLQALQLEYDVNPGEGAFYGPKLEFVLRDAIGRDWQCGTLQVDMNLPERFSLDYVDEHGERQRPVMLHRALFGSLERFIGILLEHYAGKLPAWLAPVQVSLLSITEAQNETVMQLCAAFEGAGLRCIVDDSNEKIGYKIRQQALRKVPYMVIIGAREAETGRIKLRLLDGTNIEYEDLDSALAGLVDFCSVPGWG
ncbi:MAG: threonine--tRNA ligase [Halioglobus sp.]|nr:threonine--tRNA ligase [Halioglobus sp.]